MGCSNLVLEWIGPEPAVDEALLIRRRPAVDPDAVLVERLRRRDGGAAEALMTSYGDRVYRLAIRITGNSSDAEEVVQDALWAATARSMASAGRPPSEPGSTESPPTRPIRSGRGG